MPKLRLVKLTDADVTLNVAPPGLTQAAADTLGNDMTDADGFDAILQGIAAAVQADNAWVDTWQTLVDAMDFPPGQIQGTIIGPLISDFALFAASGDAQAADLDSTLFGHPTMPAPPTAPPTTTAPVITAPVSGPSPPANNPQPGSPPDLIYYGTGSPTWPGSPTIGGPGGGNIPEVP